MSNNIYVCRKHTNGHYKLFDARLTSSFILVNINLGHIIEGFIQSGTRRYWFRVLQETSKKSYSYI